MKNQAKEFIEVLNDINDISLFDSMAIKTIIEYRWTTYTR